MLILFIIIVNQKDIIMSVLDIANGILLITVNIVKIMHAIVAFYIMSGYLDKAKIEIASWITTIRLINNIKITIATILIFGITIIATFINQDICALLLNNIFVVIRIIINIIAIIIILITCASYHNISTNINVNDKIFQNPAIIVCIALIQSILVFLGTIYVKEFFTTSENTMFVAISIIISYIYKKYVYNS
jgi:hypothetical protein